MTIKEIEKLAEEHSEWYAKNFSELIKIAYKNAFMHGYKHGKNKPRG